MPSKFITKIKITPRKKHFPLVLPEVALVIARRELAGIACWKESERRIAHPLPVIPKSSVITKLILQHLIEILKTSTEDLFYLGTN
jgi:hypothetical protein